MSFKSRFLSQDKIAFRKSVNFFGAQIIRSIAARIIFWRRVAVDGYLANAKNSLRRHGYYVWNNFVGDENLERLREEFSMAIGNPRFVTKRVYDCHGQLRVAARISESDWDYFPQTFITIKNSKLISSLLREGDAIHLEYSFWHLSKGKPTGQFEVNRDRSNSEFHIDTFHPIFKIFIFLDDVGLGDGPHEYIEGSNRAFNGRVVDEYINSISRLDGAPRASSWYIDRYSKNISTLCCPAGTLIISDTCGYHRMKELSDEGLRKCIYINLRFKPF